jgi:hypothetical protein
MGRSGASGRIASTARSAGCACIGWSALLSRTTSLAAEPGTRVVAEGPIAAAALLPLAARRPVVYSAHNLESAFGHRLEDAGLTKKQLERFERLLLQRFAESWMVWEAEMDGARALAPGARLRLVPYALDVAAIEPLPPRAGERTILSFADFTYEPNRGAVRFLWRVRCRPPGRERPPSDRRSPGAGATRWRRSTDAL